MNRFACTALAVTALSLASCQQGGTRVASAPAPVERAKNVILFIGDGMGVSTVTAARIYEGQQRGQTGEENLLSFERFPQTAMVKTYTADSQVPDSAGTATAMNAAVKTRSAYIGVGSAATPRDCVSGNANRLTSTADLAKRAGLQVGIVTTTRLTHATPAAVYGHAVHRDWEADSDIPVNQRGEHCVDLASQLAAFPFDVALGGGRDRFMGSAHRGRRLHASANLPADWAARTGGTYVETASALAAAPADGPLLGIFADSDMAYMLGRATDSAEPTLTAMTAAALTRLKAGGSGFYLMVEGGRIDHAHHEGTADRALDETVEFARAVQYAVDNTDPRETLILVTADHSHALTISGYPRRGNPILGLVVPTNRDTPSTARDGMPYTTLQYGSGPGAVESPRPASRPDEPGFRQQALLPMAAEMHGGEDVVLYGTGPGSAQVRGVMEQNRVGSIVRHALDLPEID